MADERSLFDQAAAVLAQAFKATNLGEQSALLEEALRLYRLSVAEERAKLAGWASVPSDSGSTDD